MQGAGCRCCACGTSKYRLTTRLNTTSLILRYWILIERKCLIIDVACPFDIRVNDKEREKIGNYQVLKRELKRIWKLRKVTVVPIIIRELQHQTFLVPRTPTGSIFAARQSLRMSRRSWAVVADFKTRVLRLKPEVKILGSSKSIRHIIVENVSSEIMFSS